MRATLILAVCLVLGACGGSNSSTRERDPQFSCLSGWDGSHGEFKRLVRSRMRDPSSFEHIETRVTRPAAGRQTVYMTFRARNGFGGMNQGVASGDIRHPACTLITSTVQIAS